MFIVCFLLWVLLNGRLTVEIALFGIAISVICCAVSSRLLGYNIKKELTLICKLPRFFRMLGVLLIEIWKANMAVIRMIYSRHKPEPGFVTFRTPLKTETAKAMLANFITLTPGTITGLLEDGQYTVHYLDGKMAEGISDSCFVKRLQELETGEAKNKK